MGLGLGRGPAGGGEGGAHDGESLIAVHEYSEVDFVETQGAHDGGFSGFRDCRLGVVRILMVSTVGSVGNTG